MSPTRISPALGGALAIVGALLTVVANVLHPHPLPGSTEGVLALIASHHHWPYVHALSLFGGVAMLGALVALADSITDGMAGSVARFGRMAAHAGAPLMLAGAAIDGIAQKAMANAWAAAPAAERPIIARAADAVLFIDAALFYTWVAVFLGVAFVCFGVAVAVGRAYPRWLGWIAIVGGVGCILAEGVYVAGLPAPLAPVFPIVSALDQLFLLILGVTMLRRARRAHVAGAVAGDAPAALRAA
jgi:hypothetical protein